MKKTFTNLLHVRLIKIMNFLLMFMLLPLFSNSQIISNLEWDYIDGVPEPYSIAKSKRDNSGNIISICTKVVPGEDANISITKLTATGSVIWQHDYNGVSDAKDYATNLCIDNSDNIYVSGATYDSTNNYDILVLKYDSAGNLQLTLQYDGVAHGADMGGAVSLDNNGFIYIAGMSSVTGNLTDFALIRYKPNGDFSWAQFYDYSNGYEAAVDVQFNSNYSRIYLSGASATSPTNWDYATVQYDISGTQISVVRSTSAGMGFDNPNAFHIDASNNIYITGSAIDSGYTTYNIKTIKLDSALNILWTKTFDADHKNDLANDIVVDDYGNVYLVGYTKRANDSSNIAILKYNSSGTLIWDKEYSGKDPLSNDKGKKITIIDDKIFIAAEYQSNTNLDIAILQIDSSGSILWSKFFNGEGNGYDSPTSLTVTDNDEIIVSGISYNGTSNKNITLEYSLLKIDDPVIGYDVDSSKYLKGEILMKINPKVINNDFADNLNWQYGTLYEILPDSSNQIDIDASELYAVKIYDWMTKSDSLSIARNGDTIVMDKLWSTYRILLPNTIDEPTIASNLNSLSGEIEFAQLNFMLETGNVPNDSYCASDQNSLLTAVSGINMDGAWDVETGQQHVRVGIVDGIVRYSHEDFGGPALASSKVIDGENFYTNTPLAFVSGFHEHGTAVAGIVGALRNNNMGIAGIAGGNGSPNTGVSIITLGVAKDGSEEFPISTASNAIAKGAANTYNGGFGYFCDILNNSYYYKANDYDQALGQAVKLAWDNHCLFISIRGNRIPGASYGQNALRYPGCLNPNYVVNVGASGTDGLRKDFSNNGDPYFESMTGNSVDVIAPGSMDEIATLHFADVAGTHSLPANPKYMNFNGTSAAAPHVAGLAALMLSHHSFINGYPNSLDDGDMQYLIKKYAQDLGSEGFSNVGHGLINALATLEHVDKNNGYWVMHSEQPNASFSGQLSTVGTNIQITLLAQDAPYASGTYFATLIENVYTHVIPLPLFATASAQIQDTWITHSGGLPSSQLVDGIYGANISTSISGGNINATYKTFIWQITHNSIGQAINPIFYPVVTNSLTPHFSMLMYDPAIVTEVNNTTLDNSVVSVYPNPTNDKVNIAFESKERLQVDIKIYNILGQKVYEKIFTPVLGNNTIVIPTLALTNGLYNIILSNDTHSASSKLIIQH